MIRPYLTPRWFPRATLFAFIVISITVFPSIYNQLDASSTTDVQFVKYTVKGMIVDTSGAAVTGVVAYLVAKGRYSLDSSYAVLRLPQSFSDDVASAAPSSTGAFILSTSLASDQTLPDSIGVMVELPRRFGPFLQPIDSLSVVATHSYVEYRNASCSCSPTGVRGTYQGKEFVWENYIVVMK